MLGSSLLIKHCHFMPSGGKNSLASIFELVNVWWEGEGEGEGEEEDN